MGKNQILISIGYWLFQNFLQIIEYSLKTHLESFTLKSKLPRNNALGDLSINAFSNFSFIAINKGAIEMAISNVDSVFHSLGYFSRWWLYRNTH